MAEKVGELLQDKIQDQKNFIALITVGAREYQNTNNEILRYLVNDKKMPGVYVTINKPFATMKRILGDSGVDTRMIIFIDMITKIAGSETQKTSECLFLAGPERLSSLSIALSEAVSAIPSKEKFIFFDSISTLLLYNNTGTVAKFAHFLTSKMRVWNVEGIFLSLENESDAELISQISSFSDVYLKLGDYAR
ncbi:MAG: ATPase domain-containing protein [Candidatus Micrarchaeota archaeon]